MNTAKEFKLVGYCHSCKLYFDLSLDDVREVDQPASGNWVSNMTGSHFDVGCPNCDESFPIDFGPAFIRIAEVQTEE